MYSYAIMTKHHGDILCMYSYVIRTKHLADIPSVSYDHNTLVS